MANISAPFGFIPYSGYGSAPTYEQVTALIANADTNTAYRGDPLIWKSTGYVGTGAAGTTTLAGIFMGCRYINTNLGRPVWSNYWPGSGATGDIEVYLINDPNMKFLVQVGNSTTNGIVQGNIYDNVNYGNQAAGSTLSGISAAYIDQATIATTNTLPFRIEAIITNPPGSQGAQSGAYNFAVVSFNNVSAKQLTGI